jgi:hypothetical protein
MEVLRRLDGQDHVNDLVEQNIVLMQEVQALKASNEEANEMLKSYN